MAARLPHPLFGLDYATPAGVGLHRVAGSQFAMRYLSHSSTAITATEAKALREAKIPFGLFFEDSGSRSLAGHDAGVADAEWSIRQGKDVLGVVPRVVYATTDFDPTGREAEVLPYYEAFDQTMRNAGGAGGTYGGYDLMVFLHGRGIQWMAQTYAWSGGRLYLPAQVFQYSNEHTIAGVDCDFDHAYYADFGQVYGQAPVGPHYGWFDHKLRHLHGEHISERGVMERLDKLQRQINAGHAERHTADARDHTKLQARWLFNRLWAVVHTGPNGEHLEPGSAQVKRNWSLYRRGWRGKQLWRASRGERQPL